MKRPGTGVLFTPVMLVVVCVAIIFCIGTFFRVSNVKVVGAESYTEEEIVNASGIENGDNLFFINCAEAASNVFSRLSYIEKVQIKRSLPGRVVIEITESNAVAYITSGDSKWAVGSDGILIGKISDKDAGTLAAVSGIEIPSPKENGDIAELCSDKEKAGYIVEILSAISSRGLGGKITAIAIDDKGEATATYEKRLEAKLGSKSETAYKLALLQSAVGQLDSAASGILTIETAGKVRYTPA